ncbi:MAG TPA: hypothetical protein PK802_03680 [Candidatus Cloacimonadota bacterium]|jgi:hypothetical protein|nr:hypothetical protein [Candidatus Cloacimonadota bacterium]HOC95439.1 hypothetical protein [Candidatus Cloacimonadota bacterium]HOG31489.1 hypothetical protein [Candidatus Cloacimonadota bacterium]HOR59485.1 hypothetical protein [Candidatus Cloacimonadota bacterium]HPB08773.1 hypothetical protein [Candidatus Cloacimonadota bacterium]
MSVLLDIIGSVIIAGLLLIMLTTFQYQLTETAERHMYAASMASHMEQASTRLNHLIGLAGLGIEDPRQAVVIASENRFIFRSYWDFEKDTMGATSGPPNVLSIVLVEDANEAMGSAVLIRQGNDAYIEDDVVLENMGYIFWVKELKYKYYDLYGHETHNTDEVRSVDIMLTFRREGPMMDSRGLENRLQLRCYLMNTWLQLGTS